MKFKNLGWLLGLAVGALIVAIDNQIVYAFFIGISLSWVGMDVGRMLDEYFG